MTTVFLYRIVLRNRPLLVYSNQLRAGCMECTRIFLGETLEVGSLVPGTHLFFALEMMELSSSIASIQVAKCFMVKTTCFGLVTDASSVSTKVKPMLV